MSAQLVILVSSAASIGLVHTLLGPDHYVPLVAMAKARGWTLRRTLWITTFCGIGHILGSIILGAVGISAGIALRSLEIFESRRGEFAGWMIIAFGLTYLTWSAVQLWRNRTHTHVHAHGDGTVHHHRHDHHGGHSHPHPRPEHTRSLVPWSLFVIFVLGPCEPLIPLLMFPAAALNTSAVFLVALVFSAVTVGTMVTMVTLLSLGLRMPWSWRFGRYAHPVAGALILLCGIAVQLGA